MLIREEINTWILYSPYIIFLILQESLYSHRLFIILNGSCNLIFIQEAASQAGSRADGADKYLQNTYITFNVFGFSCTVNQSSVL